MKKRDQFPDHRNLLSGELYLFHSTNRPSPATGSLFGIIDKIADGLLYLESSSSDFMVMMPKVVGVVLDQMTRIVRFWSFAFLNNSIIAVQEKIPLYKVLKMLFRESAMDS